MKLKKVIIAGMLAVMAVGITACSSDDKDNNEEETKAAVNVELTDIRDAVKEAYGEDYIPNMEYDNVFINETLGLSEEDYEKIVAEGPLVSFNIDTFIAVKAKEGKADTVEEKLNGYRDYLINDSMMYPVNAVKIQASKVIRHGDYVFFVCLGVIDTSTEEKGDEEILKEAQEKNNIAVDVIDGFFE